MDKRKSLRKDLIQAWERYINKTNTCDDLVLILDSVKDDDCIQEFDEVASRMWDKVMNDLQPTPEEKEMYKRKAAQFLAEYNYRQKLQKRRLTSENFRKIWYAAAAAAILLGLVIPAYLYMKPKTEQVVAVHYVEESTQRGEIRTVILPDQTRVTLNVGSHLKYPVNFAGAERSVELYGEALFDVTSDPTRPFTVKTENLNIKVVGTVFDVKEYADDLTASVSVASGKVEVGLPDEKVMLEQNQQFKIDKTMGFFEKTSFDVDNCLSWTDGTLYFHRTPIREVVNILNRHYSQVDIELAEGEYSSILISGEHGTVYTVEEVLSAIVYITDLKCRKTADNKYILFHEK